MVARSLLTAAGLALLLATAGSARAQVVGQRPDSGNRLANPFRAQFRPAWTLPIKDPVKLIDIGPVTDPKKSNLVLLVGGRNAADTQRTLRVTHWNGAGYDTDAESVSQSVGIDTLLVGRFQPAPAAAPTIAPAADTTPQKRSKAKPLPVSKLLQVLTNSGIYGWNSSSLQATFPRQLPDIKQSIVLYNRPDLVVIGAGSGATAFEFTPTEMRPVAAEKLQGAGYARFGIGTQPFSGSATMNLSPGIRYAQAIWTGRTKWLIGLVRGTPAGTPQDPTATTGDRIIVFTPKFASRDKAFWESRIDDFEEAWRSEPLAGHTLDVRVGDPHNDGKIGILVLTSENDDKDRRLTFFEVSSVG